MQRLHIKKSMTNTTINLPDKALAKRGNTTYPATNLITAQRIIGVLKTAKEFRMTGWIAKQAVAGAAGMTMLMQEWKVVMIVEVASKD